MKKTIIKTSIIFMVFSLIISCNTNSNKKAVKEDVPLVKGTFSYDKAFLQKHYKNSIILESKDKKSSIVLSPELQGRVMTSTLNGGDGVSFGWLNYDLISSKKINEHFNPFGGEERFWIGPEGGQYSIYFKKDKKFEFENWHVPASIDRDAFSVLEKNEKSVTFQKDIKLTNYSGTKFNIDVQRKISLLSNEQIKESLKLASSEFSSVAYETQNIITNVGENEWNEESGMISIWLLSMMTPSPEVTVVAPIIEGAESDKGIKVNDNYFGKVASDRLKSTEKNVFFKADGKSRGKIGFSPIRSNGYIGSYDGINEVLTILQIAKPKASDKYVNSAWEIQENPYIGDILNSYNDGPLEDGSQMGPFYELESSSPALGLKPQESYNHTQRIYHFKGSKMVLDEISKKILNISIREIETVF